jgi:hypothetical protein
MLDERQLHGPAFAADDALRAGRTRYNGGSFRAIAAELADSLGAALGRRPWVQAVVVVWDEFPQRRHEDDRVVYVAGSELTSWLGEQPGKLTADQRDRYAAAVARLRHQTA